MHPIPEMHDPEQRRLDHLKPEHRKTRFSQLCFSMKIVWRDLSPRYYHCILRATLIFDCWQKRSPVLVADH